MRLRSSWHMYLVSWILLCAFAGLLGVHFVQMHNVDLDCIGLNGLKAHRVVSDSYPVHCGSTITLQPFRVGGRSFDKGFGVHSYSRIEFKLDGHYQRLKTKAGLPDYLINTSGSVIFNIFGDNRLLWTSGVVKAGRLMEADIDISRVRMLTLEVTDAGDGQSFDHACWLEPELTIEVIDS